MADNRLRGGTYNPSSLGLDRFGALHRPPNAEEILKASSMTVWMLALSARVQVGQLLWDRQLVSIELMHIISGHKVIIVRSTARRIFIDIQTSCASEDVEISDSFVSLGGSPATARVLVTAGGWSADAVGVNSEHIQISGFGKRPATVDLRSLVSADSLDESAFDDS